MLRYIYNARQEMTNKLAIILSVSHVHFTPILSAEICDFRMHPNTSVGFTVAGLANGRCSKFYTAL